MRKVNGDVVINLFELFFNGKNERELLYSKVIFFDFVIFLWFNLLFVIGKKKLFEQDEILEVDVKDFVFFFF